MTQTMSNSISSGVYIVGDLLGYEEVPWSNNPEKFNRRIGLKTGEYEAGFGRSESNIQTVDIQQADVNYILGIVDKLKDKKVIVPVVYRARAGGKNGAFLGCFMPKDSKIQVIA